MRIAVLAWGSLLWDRRGLNIVDHFKPTGPPLSLEFSRVSNDRRLTLVIDEDNGGLCDTYAAESTLSGRSDAIENLRRREGTTEENIGFIDLATGEKIADVMQRHPRAVGVVEAWTKANGYDPAIWTALESNFHEPDKAGEPFGVPPRFIISTTPS